MTTLKILIATGLYPPDVGGPATYSKTIEAEFPKRGVEARVVAFRSIRHLPRGIRHIAYFALLVRKSYGIDLIYAQDPVSVGLPAYLAALFLHKPFALKVVGDYAWEQGKTRFGVKENLDAFVEMKPYPFPVAVLRAIETFVARRADRIIVPSQYLKKIVRKWGIEAGKITVVYNSFEHDLPLFVERREEPREEKTIMSAGRLVPWKGFLTLVALMHDLMRHFPSVKLVIAGDGPDRRMLERCIRDRGLSQNVFLTGALPVEKLDRYVQGADVFVLNTSYEGFSHQLLEVMAVGTPIVTTRVGGNPELIEDGVTGLLVAPDDRPALIRAIEKVLLDEEFAGALAAAAHKKVSEFTVDRMVKETLAVLKSAVRSS